MFLTVNFTLARLASDLKFTLANRKFHSPWRVWRVLISTPAVQKSMTDRRTDGHPKPIGPQPFGLGPNKSRKHFYHVKICKETLTKHITHVTFN